MFAVNAQGMRRLLTFFLLSFFSSSFFSALQAREIWEGGIPEEEFQAKIEEYKRDPGAMSRWPERVMREISTEQLHRGMMELDTTHFTYLYPMVIPGYQFPELKGLQLSELSIMAVRGGKLIPIPFQFDEYDKTGLVWIEGTSKKNPEGEVGVFDDFDELIFMFRDGGHETYKRNEHGEIQGQILREIRLDSPSNRPRYVYLVQNNPQRSDADYVNIDLDKGRVETTLMEVNYDKKNFLDMQKVVPKAGPRYGENVLDSVYLNLSTGILNQNLRVSMNSENNIRAVPVAIKDGPVRATMLIKTKLSYMYMPVLLPSQKFNLRFHEQAIQVPSRFAIESLGILKYFVLLLREPKVEVALDFKNLEGAEITFDSVYGSGKTGVVDGEMSDFEHEINLARLPGDWMHLDSNQGWAIFFSNHLPVVEGGLFDQMLEGLRIEILYEDDPFSYTKYENDPGASPRVGFKATGLPHEAMKLAFAIPKLNYSDMDSLGEALYALVEAYEEDKEFFKKYDEAASEVMGFIKSRGTFNTPEKMIDGFIADFDRMDFKGIDRHDFNSLIRDSFVQTVDDITQIDHGKVLVRMVELAEERNIDLRALRYATMDNTLWLADWVGPQGPGGYHQEVKNPPDFVIRKYYQQTVAAPSGKNTGEM